MSFNPNEWTYEAPTLDKPWVKFSFSNTGKAYNFIQQLTDMAGLSCLKLDTSRFFFRGEDGLYDLVPKFCRIMNSDMSLEHKLNYEFDSINYFRERAGHYLSASQLPKNPWDIGDWLALMRHYGAATRLLDWTTSIYVAIYFAVHSKPTKTGCVWVVNNVALKESMPLSGYGFDKDPEIAKKIYTDKDAFVKFGTKTAKPIIRMFDSACKTRRISAQQGVFTICHQQGVNHGQLIGKQLMTAYPLTEGLEKNFQKQLWRFEITPELKKYLRQRLSTIGMSAVTLFPGLDGLGRAVTEILTTYTEAWTPTNTGQ